MVGMVSPRVDLCFLFSKCQHKLRTEIARAIFSIFEISYAVEFRPSLYYIVDTYVVHLHIILFPHLDFLHTSSFKRHNSEYCSRNLGHFSLLE